MDAPVAHGVVADSEESEPQSSSSGDMSEESLSTSEEGEEEYDDDEDEFEDLLLAELQGMDSEEGEQDADEDDGGDEGSEEGNSEDSDDDEYRNATTLRVSKQVTALEEGMTAGVLYDMPTAVQRGCVLYALPDACGAFECVTKAQHFQTMDCLALVPPPPPTTSPAQHGSPNSPSSSQSTAPAAPAGMQPPGSSTSPPTVPWVTADAPSTSSATAPPAPGAAWEQQGAAAGGAAPQVLPLPGSAPGPDGREVEVLIGGPSRLSICRLPPPGRPGPLREVCRIGLLTNHFSLAASPDGRFVAAAGESGMLYIFAYVRGESADSSGAAGAHTAAAAAAAERTAGPPGASPSSPPPPPPPPTTTTTTTTMPSQQQPQQQHQSRGAPSSSAGEPAGQQQPQPQTARLVCLAAFGFPLRGGFWGMNNMVRFGYFGGSLRLLVATQAKAIYFFNLPHWDGSPGPSLERITDPRVFLCTGLQPWVLSWRPAPSPQQPQEEEQQQPPPPPQQPPELLGPLEPQPAPAAPAAAMIISGDGVADNEHGTGTASQPHQPQRRPQPRPPQRYPNAAARRYWHSRRLPTSRPQPDINQEALVHAFIPDPRHRDQVQLLSGDDTPATCALEGFRQPLNCAEASPDGRWLAVGCDEPVLYLVPAGADYRLRPIEPLFVPLPAALTPGRLAPGCQYTRFSGDSQRLAASFDSLFTVFVFDVPRRQLLLSVRHLQRQPPLALSFPPGQPRLLLHSAHRQHLVALDVEEPRTSMTRISIKPPAARTPPPTSTSTPSQQPAPPPPPPPPPPQQQQQQQQQQQPQRQEGQQSPPHAAGGPTAEHAPPAAGDAAAAAAGAAAGSSSAAGGSEGDEAAGEEGAAAGAAAATAASSVQDRRRLRRLKRPPHVTGLVTTADGRLLVTTETELLSFQLLLPNTPWSRRLHPHMPPAFRAATRALLMCAAAGKAVTPASPPDTASAAAAAGRGGGGGDGGSTGSAGREEAGVLGDGGGGQRPTGLWSLPHDVVEMIVAAAAQPRLVWVEAEAEEALAYPCLDLWDRSMRRAGGGGGEGLEGEGAEVGRKRSSRSVSDGSGDASGRRRGGGGGEGGGDDEGVGEGDDTAAGSGSSGAAVEGEEEEENDPWFAWDITEA